MKRKLLFIATMVTFGFFLSSTIVAQSFEESGAFYCSQKKQHSHSAEVTPMGPNSPMHTYDVIKYTMNIELMDNFD